LLNQLQLKRFNRLIIDTPTASTYRKNYKLRKSFLDMEKEEVHLREGNIGLMLDSYDDIFSDFDPRPYSEKALSDDFLLECKKAAIDKAEGIEIRMLMPKKRRNFYDEHKIKKRLKNHFLHHYHEKRKEIKKIKLIGFAWFLLGTLAMLLATYLSSYLATSPTFGIRLLFIMLEPAGWFFFWEGLDKIFREARDKKPDYIFYKKMINAKINFVDYRE
jgi:hypothetical protein